MDEITVNDLCSLYLPPLASHKGQNGRLLIIGGSHLFHAASIWAATVASRIVDLVHYSSVPENNEIITRAKIEFRNGIVIPRQDLDSYIREDDCILIGPGMTRDKETKELTDRLFQKYPDKQWVIDAGALQMADIRLIPKNSILTPHQGEFSQLRDNIQNSKSEIRKEISVSDAAQILDCIILLKGVEDIACSPAECRIIKGGNAGMTKGGTGDVLSGLIAALACKNDPFLATVAGSYINKTAGDALFTSVGPYFNSTDLAGQIPVTMHQLFTKQA